MSPPNVLTALASVLCEDKLISEHSLLGLPQTIPLPPFTGTRDILLPVCKCNCIWPLRIKKFPEKNIISKINIKILSNFNI